MAVYDRQTGTFTEQRNAHERFRSASVVKLLIAIDHLWNRGPGYTLPADDRARLDAMLRASDDAAATYYWGQNGGPAIVGRMVSRLALTDTAGPPPGSERIWGYTAMSAADTVQIYRWLLERAPAGLRDIVMGNLRASTRCGTDGFDQRFGIPSVFAQPWAVKQGWSGFGSRGPCGATSAAPAVREAASVDAAGVELARPALHTTGTVGAGDRTVVAVFTLHPEGTSFDSAYATINRVVRSLTVPGATPLPGG
ncbi:hypothetical protein AB0M97_29805 [Streptomyces sp. NPDC051207]|uniref:hypothetical protein n=1 Tax=Streptomyces sp. NPDC051207 TaxID=3154641 RepID=UPI003442C1DF